MYCKLGPASLDTGGLMLIDYAPIIRLNRVFAVSKAIKAKDTPWYAVLWEAWRVLLMQIYTKISL